MLSFTNVYKYIGDNTILDNISFNVEADEVVSIIGKSGSGKSTCIRCATGVDQINDGSIILDDKFTTVFQKPSLFVNMTVIDNILYSPVKMHRQSADKIKSKSIQMLKIFNLEDKLDSYPAHLSGGQQQIIAIIRAIALDTKILMLDEPTSALDAATIDHLIRLINTIKKGRAILISSHELSFTYKVSNRIICMQNGTIQRILDKQNLESGGEELALML